MIAGRREEPLAEAADALGPRASYVVADMREEADAERIVSACLDRHGRLDVLVNNAGGRYFVPAEAIAPKGWRARRGAAATVPLGRLGSEQVHAWLVALAASPLGTATAGPAPGRRRPCSTTPAPSRPMSAT